jgi:protein-S-isoprenylcysteine O-methyltransferase Ste14
MLIVAKIGGLLFTIACWIWVLNGRRSDGWNMMLIWCAPLFTFPIALLGRVALDVKPEASRAQWMNVPVHYAMMIVLGGGLFPGFQVVLHLPTATIPVFKPMLSALVVLTGIAAFLTVLNLAWRGLGAPFAMKLSSRLATDWMYAWTRNPMLLCTLAWFLSLVLWHPSTWGVLWVIVCVTPGWIFFVRVYEERELEIRFGPSYAEYRKQTPFLWPRRPRPNEHKIPSAPA